MMINYMLIFGALFLLSSASLIWINYGLNWIKRQFLIAIIATVISAVVTGIYFYCGDLNQWTQRLFVLNHQQDLQQALKTWQDHPNLMIQTLQHQLVEHPKDATARRLLASIYLKQRMFKAAQTILQPLYEQDLHLVVIDLMMAEALQGQKEFKQSLSILKHTLLRSDIEPESQWVLGVLATRAGDAALALKAWRHARAAWVLRGTSVKWIDQAIDQLIKQSKSS